MRRTVYLAERTGTEVQTIPRQKREVTMLMNLRKLSLPHLPKKMLGHAVLVLNLVLIMAMVKVTELHLRVIMMTKRRDPQAKIAVDRRHSKMKLKVNPGTVATEANLGTTKMENSPAAEKIAAALKGRHAEIIPMRINLAFPSMRKSQYLTLWLPINMHF